MTGREKLVAICEKENVVLVTALRQRLFTLLPLIEKYFIVDSLDRPSVNPSQICYSNLSFNSGYSILLYQDRDGRIIERLETFLGIYKPTNISRQIQNNLTEKDFESAFSIFK
jgi:hypothetical protein